MRSRLERRTNEAKLPQLHWQSLEARFTDAIQGDGDGGGGAITRHPTATADWHYWVCGYTSYESTAMNDDSDATVNTLLIFHSNNTESQDGRQDKSNSHVFIRSHYDGRA